MRLKSKVSFSSSAVTTRVTSAAARGALGDAEQRSALQGSPQDFRLKVTAFKEARDDNTRGRSSAIGRGASVRTRLAPGLLLAKAELLHLDLEALARDLEQARRVGDVAAGLLERAADELALERSVSARTMLLERPAAGERSRSSPSGSDGALGE